MHSGTNRQRDRLTTDVRRMGACQEAAEAAQTGTIQVICRLILSAFSPGKYGRHAGSSLNSSGHNYRAEPYRPAISKQTLELLIKLLNACRLSAPFNASNYAANSAQCSQSVLATAPACAPSSASGTAHQSCGAGAGRAAYASHAWLIKFKILPAIFCLYQRALRGTHRQLHDPSPDSASGCLLAHSVCLLPFWPN